MRKAFFQTFIICSLLSVELGCSISNQFSRSFRVADSLPGCEYIIEEEKYCMTFIAEERVRPAMIGLESGSVCQVKRFLKYITPRNEPSLGWLPGKLLACSGEHGVVLLDIASGDEELIPAPCEAVTTDGRKIILWNSLAEESQSNVLVYDSLENLRNGQPSEKLNIGFSASRIAAGRGTIFAAWHSTDHIETAKRTDSRKAKIELEGYNDWVNC